VVCEDVFSFLLENSRTHRKKKNMTVPPSRKLPPINGGKKLPPPFRPATFVNQELTREQREHLKGIRFEYDDVENCLANALDSGYSVKLSVDSRNNCYAAWLVPTDANNPNFGYILSGRGSTPIKALKQVWFLHEAIYQREWGVGHGKSSEPIDD